ncbi:uncharacterized protein J4E78_001510 [Alternaria triticimaculans]|uniref:uncharacterized protein n=1 Tax=Alternaria triticimaculans TaxID=297637 RepID=UPI0020C1BC5E|nr:uncharacterized protein J4E78_001510 [Alternaria triticimaculans]KAI4673007.1 hypothetical protein J4E78_001510 [Alternaria triticimaculans]
MTSLSRLPPTDPALENEKLVAQLKLARDEIDRLEAHNNNLIQCLLESERAFARLKALNEKGGKRKRDLPSPFEEGLDADESASKTEEGYRPKFFENLVCGMSKPQEEKKEEEKPRKKARTRRRRHRDKPAPCVEADTSRDEVYETALSVLVYLPKKPVENIADSIPTPWSRKIAKQRLAVCIRCFENDRRCDSGDPCQSCLKNRAKCQRARCANYKAGTCFVPTCTRAHEDDQRKYKNIVHAGHVSKKDMVAGP